MKPVTCSALVIPPLRSASCTEASVECLAVIKSSRDNGRTRTTVNDGSRQAVDGVGMEPILIAVTTDSDDFESSSGLELDHRLLQASSGLVSLSPLQHLGPR